MIVDKEVKVCASLGVTIKSNGSFSIHINTIREKAHKAYFSIISKSRQWGGYVFVFIYLTIRLLLFYIMHQRYGVLKNGLN